MRPVAPFRRLPAWCAAVAALLPAGCSLEEVTLVEAEEVVVAEVYLQLTPARPDLARATAWLHRTLEAGSPASRPVPGAQILLSAERGFSVELAETAAENCVFDTPVLGTGSCYATSAALAAEFRPGDRLTVEVALPGGGLLVGRSTVPGDFALVGPAGAGACSVDPFTPTELRWSRSEGAWAYLSETRIAGLRAALAPQGIEVEKDPLYLLGLSVSAADTTIVFPGEFGVFDRLELDQALAVALQKGLPSGTQALVSVTAADRNYVNWARGGNFNPSGVVRVPSVRGDGTGVFATSVSRRFDVGVRGEGGAPSSPLCSGGPPQGR